MMNTANTRKSRIPLRHFTITRHGRAWALTEHFKGHIVATKLVKTEAEANRLRQRLSDEHVIGFVARGAFA